MSYAIVPVPARLGLRADGVQSLPRALLDAGLADALGASVVAPLAPPPWRPDVDRATGVLNARGIATLALALADAVTHELDRGRFPVVLGGDCSILLGCLLATRRRGRHGLVFLDGHADFYQPDAEPAAEAASMELGFATGRGPALLGDLGGLGPLVRDEDVLVLGHRDAAAAAVEGSRPLPDSIAALDLDEIRSLGIEEAARRAGDRRRPFWVHLDADVLDDAIMPAVDYRQPGGLTWSELERLLNAALGSGRAIGLDVTILNPRLDLEGRVTRAFAEFMVSVLQAAPARGDAGW